jgi:hypothetical protein
MRDRTLMAQPFDASKMQPTGEPVFVAEQGFNTVLDLPILSHNGVVTYMTAATPVANRHCSTELENL